MSFSNKVVLVTGGSSGIGAGIAILFSKEGANVAIVGRNTEKLKNVAAKCEQNGKKPLVIKADVTNDDDAKHIVNETINKFGRLDVLINNAGMMINGRILDGTALESYDTVMNVNVRAVVNITTLAAPYLVESKGNIVNISAVAAKSLPFNPDWMSYFVSKAALDHFTKCTALELASSGVRVNSVNPGPVTTDFLDNAESVTTFDKILPMTALHRVSETEEIADLVLYIVSDKARGMTGSIVVYDNGYLLKN